jgi:hypothetical protein
MYDMRFLFDPLRVHVHVCFVFVFIWAVFMELMVVVECADSQPLGQKRSAYVSFKHAAARVRQLMPCTDPVMTAMMAGKLESVGPRASQSETDKDSTAATAVKNLSAHAAVTGQERAAEAYRIAMFTAEGWPPAADAMAVVGAAAPAKPVSVVSDAHKKSGSSLLAMSPTRGKLNVVGGC